MVAITGKTGGIKTAAIANRDPVTSGLTGGTQRQEGRVTNLVPQESLVSDAEQVGF